MPLNFPTSPVLNQLYTFNSKTWKWDGAGWVSYNIGLIGPTGATGPVGFYVSNINGVSGGVTLIAGTGITFSTSVSGITLSSTLISGGTGGSIQYKLGSGFTGSTQFAVTTDSGGRITNYLLGGSGSSSLRYNIPSRSINFTGNEFTINDSTELGATLQHYSRFVAANNNYLTIRSDETTAFSPDPAIIQIAGGDFDNVPSTINLYSSSLFLGQAGSNCNIVGNGPLTLTDRLYLSNGIY